MPRILIVSDEQSRTYLCDALNHAQFEVDCLMSESQALDFLVFNEPDLILLDLPSCQSELPAICERLRGACATPIVVCSASDLEQELVQTLESGADDYLVMPVQPVELVARARAVLRRCRETEAAILHASLSAGDLEVRVNERKALRRGEVLDLTPIEFKLLTLLVRNAGHATPWTKLIARVWGAEYVNCRHYLRLYIRYLRSKIEDNPDNPELILTEWGFGYRFQPKEMAA